MSVNMISQEEILAMWAADPENAWRDYYVKQGPDLLGSSNRQTGPTTYIARDYTYETTKCNISSWQAAAVYVEENGAPQPVRSGWSGGTGGTSYGIMPAYSLRQITVNTFWYQVWSGGNPTSGNEGTFYGLAGDVRSDSMIGDYSWTTEAFPATLVLDIPVFKNVSDYQTWIDRLRAWRADPTNETLWDQLKDALSFALNPKTPGEGKDPYEDPDNPGDEDEGGEGEKKKPRNPVPVPGLPTVGAANAGFLTLYKLTQPEMANFADDCIASDLWEALKLMFGNPMDFIVGCSLVPFTPTGSSVWHPKFGIYTFPHEYSKVDNQFVEINCGDLYIEPFGNNFLDYAPYTRITIFLPYIGYRELDVDEIMGKTINVTYHCDCLSGDCVAFVSVSAVGETGPQIPVVLATFSGNCALDVPFASESFNSLISNSVAMLANTIPAMSGVKESVPAAINSAMQTTMSQNGDVQKGGAIGSSNGYMGVQKPYIVRHIPIVNTPSAFGQTVGFASNISGPLGSSGFSGYVEVENIQLNDIPAMEPEREEIRRLLREGVII